MMNVLYIRCGRPLQIIGYFFGNALHKWSPYVIGRCPVGGGPVRSPYLLGRCPCWGSYWFCWPSTTRRATDARSCTADKAMDQSFALFLALPPLVPAPGVRLLVLPFPYLRRSRATWSWLAQYEWMQGQIKEARTTCINLDVMSWHSDQFVKLGHHAVNWNMNQPGIMMLCLTIFR